MTLLVTDAIVLHASNYLESSRILRLGTREAGVQSVLARGARSSRKRFGSAVDLFAEGQAHIQVKPGRDLHTLLSFDVQRVHSGMALDLGRFTAATALAECTLHFVHDEGASRVFDTIVDGMQAIAVAEVGDVAGETMGVLWRMIAEIGVAPALEICAACHTPLSSDGDVMFSHHLGGALCENCALSSRGGRRLPAEARAALIRWLSGELVSLETRGTVQAHQRLFREFAAHHLGDARPLKAYKVWEHGQWSDHGSGNPSVL